jgi:hypothetical protein
MASPSLPYERRMHVKELTMSVWFRVGLCVQNNERLHLING